jgi:hypothetical protein
MQSAFVLNVISYFEGMPSLTKFANFIKVVRKSKLLRVYSYLTHVTQTNPFSRNLPYAVGDLFGKAETCSTLFLGIEQKITYPKRFQGYAPNNFN